MRMGLSVFTLISETVLRCLKSHIPGIFEDCVFTFVLICDGPLIFFPKVVTDV